MNQRIFRTRTEPAPSAAALLVPLVAALAFALAPIVVASPVRAAIDADLSEGVAAHPEAQAEEGVLLLPEIEGADDARPGDGEPLPAYVLTPVALGLEHPWSIAFLPDGRLLVTERTGRLRIVTDDGLDPLPVAGVPEVPTTAHLGLLDVVVDPAFRDNGLIYLSHIHGDEEANALRVLRARLTGHALHDVAIIYETPGFLPRESQLGGRMAFGGDGRLFLTLGDRWERDRAQDLGAPMGKIIRIDTDGRSPDDNPFAAAPGALAEIWSYGHRNPQGLAFDPATGRLWSHEHGPQGGDEVNLIAPGANYGWPLATHGVDYDGTPIGSGPAAPGVKPPEWVWNPSVAPSGLAVYRGDRMPGWDGDLLLGALRGEALIRLRVTDAGITEETRHFENEVGRIRDVRVSPDGDVWLVTDAPDGGLYRVDPAPLTARSDPPEAPGASRSGI